RRRLRMPQNLSDGREWDTIPEGQRRVGMADVMKPAVIQLQGLEQRAPYAHPEVAAGLVSPLGGREYDARLAGPPALSQQRLSVLDERRDRSRGEFYGSDARPRF